MKQSKVMSSPSNNSKLINILQEVVDLSLGVFFGFFFPSSYPLCLCLIVKLPLSADPNPSLGDTLTALLTSIALVELSHHQSQHARKQQGIFTLEKSLAQYAYTRLNMLSAKYGTTGAVFYHQ